MWGSSEVAVGAGGVPVGPGAQAATSVDLADTLGPQIRELRHRRNLTLTELAARTSLPIGQLSQVERALSTPTIRQLQEISGALGVKIGWFFQPGEGTGAPSLEPAIVVRAGGGARSATTACSS